MKLPFEQSIPTKKRTHDQKPLKINPRDNILKNIRTENQQDIIAAKTGEAMTWEDVGDEFKQAVYELLTLFRSSIKKKHKSCSVTVASCPYRCRTRNIL